METPEEKYFKCLGCNCQVPESYREDNTNLDYCYYCGVPKVEDLQEADLQKLDTYTPSPASPADQLVDDIPF